MRTCAKTGCCAPQQFSDGVGYDWVDGLRDYAAAMVSDADWAAAAQRFPEDTPRTREYFLLRGIFEGHFPHPSAWKTVPKVAACSPEWLPLPHVLSSCY